eukprot:7673358-Lingulodinium_polyedra.AAC.1
MGTAEFAAKEVAGAFLKNAGADDVGVQCHSAGDIATHCQSILLETGTAHVFGDIMDRVPAAVRDQLKSIYTCCLT